MATKRISRAHMSDVSLDIAGADPVEAFVVEPREGAARAGVLFLHWLGEHHNNRTQFLSEASALAELGVRSVLPAGRLPWLVPPSDADTDAANIELEGRRLDRALAELASPLGRKVPLAIVGHDFGAMHGILLAARQPRVGRWSWWRRRHAGPTGSCRSGRSPATPSTTGVSSRPSIRRPHCRERRRSSSSSSAGETSTSPR